MPQSQRSKEKDAEFARRYGSFAVIAGASEGLGAAFAHAIAERGVNLLLLARRGDRLEAVAEECRARGSVEVRCAVFDLGAPELSAGLARLAGELEIGLAIYNAAFVPFGPFADREPADLDRAVDVNARGPTLFARQFLPPMLARRRGGIVLMSSLAGAQGTPGFAVYSATKAYNAVLAEALWHEAKGASVDVLACCAGAVRTPGFRRASEGDVPGTLDPDEVVERTLCSLSRGPRVIPGAVNRVAAFALGRLLPKRAAIRIMADSTAKLSSATNAESET